MIKKHFLFLAVAMFWAVLGSSQALLAAPPGWELRNGSWVPIVPPGVDTPDGQVAQMIEDLANNETKKLISDARKWIKANKKHPLMPQVMLLQGDAEVARGNKYKALYSYEDILNNYPTSELFPHVLEREYNIADAFLRGYKKKFLGLRILSVEGDAIELLDRIQDRQRGSPMAERAGLRVADYYYTNGQFRESTDAYNDFIRRYPYSQYVRKAEMRRAESSLANFRGILFDFTPLYDGRERLAALQEAYPQTSESLQIRAIDDRIYQLEGKKELEIARYYWRAGKKHASGYYYKRVIANWPDTLSADAARKELALRMPQEANK